MTIAKIKNKYLTEPLVGEILACLYEGSEIIKDKPYSTYKFRPDFFLPHENLVVEFDGYQHYTKSCHVIADLKKDSVLRSDNVRVVRIPYFVQLSSEVIKQLFNVNYHYDQTYPHGFIDKNAVLPADFCELGVYRFINDLERFSFIETEIVHSLNNQISLLGDINLVVPRSLHNKFNS